MNIAIIGAGNIGTGLARVLSPTRNGVVLAGRNLAKVREAAEAAGTGAHPVRRRASTTPSHRRRS